MRHGLSKRWWPLFLASTTIMMITLLLSSSLAVVEARELSLYRADDGDAGTTASASNHHKTSTTITLKRRAVLRQPQPTRHQQAAEEAPTTGTTSIAATTSNSTTEDSDRTLLLENERNIAEARDMSDDSTMLADEVEQEAVEEERLHRERREMFLRNLQLDAGGGTGLMSTSVRPSIDLSMDTSSPFEPTKPKHGVNSGGDDADSPSGGVPDDEDKEAAEKCPPPAIDLTALRKEAYDYELQEEGEEDTKSGEQQPEMPPTIDLFDLRKKAVEHYELQKTLVHEPTFSSQGKIEETNSGEQMVSSSIDLLDLRMKAKDFEGLEGLQRNLGRTDTYLRNRFPQAIKEG
jgi:hypothetical protein